MAIGIHCEEEAARRLIDNAVFELRQSGLMASFGVAVFHPGDSFEAVCQDADMNMYSDKTAHKSDSKTLN